MTHPVRNGEELNAKKLRAFLHQKELINSEDSSIQISQFTNGYSNLTYQLLIENKAFVLRRPPFGAIKRGHDMGREYRVLSKLKTAFAPCPQVFVFDDSMKVMDAPFYIMEKVEGIILSFKEAKSRKILPAEYQVISDTWLNTYVDLHAVDYQACGLESLGRPEGYVERQVTNWSNQYLKAATSEVPEAQTVMQWLHDHHPTQYEHSLIHNDFKYDNVVFSDPTWKNISAVLDWEMCTLGDPLMDLGTSLAYWTTSSDGALVKSGLPSPTMFEGNPSRMEIVEAYSKKSGRPVTNLTFYYAFGLFKIAVIAQQIFYRYKHGHTTNEKFATLDQSARFLCINALQAIQKNKIENLF